MLSENTDLTYGTFVRLLASSWVWSGFVGRTGFMGALAVRKGVCIATPILRFDDERGRWKCCGRQLRFGMVRGVCMVGSGWRCL